MAISKPRPSGMRQIFVYDPRVGRKVYVGSRRNLRGPGGARQLERDKTIEFSAAPAPAGEMTCEQYAERWLDAKHGDGTRRPSPTTLQVNRGLLRPFLERFGERVLRGGIGREEALDWSRRHPANAKAVSAMFNDAVDDERTDANPFGNRRLPEPRGRRDIVPLAEGEVARLCEIALAAHGAYGPVVAAWITFMAWSGCRPGETATCCWEDCDLDAGRLTVPRIKGERQTDVVVLPGQAVRALEAMPLGERGRSGRLFSTPQGAGYGKGSFGYYWRPLRTAFKATLDPGRRAELEQAGGALDLYALRHFCGSLMADRGANEFEIAAQLGNSAEVCRRHYIHVYRDRVNERNAGFLAESRAGVVDLGERRRGA